MLVTQRKNQEKVNHTGKSKQFTKATYTGHALVGVYFVLLSCQANNLHENNQVFEQAAQ